MTTLNLFQQQAVEYRNGHLLIIAGPGTGKTHTLTQRINSFIPSLNKDQKVLAVTFTNKAADEMRQRLGDTQQVLVGTFHSFSLALLRQYVEHTDLPQDFRVISPDEADVKPEGVLSFDDLLLEALMLLERDAKIRSRVQDEFPFIFVDEYQDINQLQKNILQTLIGLTNQITAIGDPNQAIYSFRGSNVGFFNRFGEDFPGAKLMSLSDNYRSAPNLLSASTQVIAKSSFEVPPLVATIYTQGHLTVFEAPSEAAEAENVVHQIEKMVGGTSMFSQDSGRVETEQEANRSFGDICVLYRLNAQKHALIKAFERSGIPYQASGDKHHQEEGSVIVSSEKVNLMTIHAAKGLEFPVVFIVGCEENLLPLNLKGLDSDIEEERRLFYVAMTRAKEQLFLFYAKKRFIFGKLYKNAPSPFLADIEEKLKVYQRQQAVKKKVKTETQLNLFR